MKIKSIVLRLFIPLLVTLSGVVPIVAQTSGQEATEAVGKAIETRQQTQQQLDQWSEQKAELVQRMRTADANVKWLQERKALTEAELTSVREGVSELERRLDEADRLEDSIQDTLMVALGRLETSVAGSQPFLPQERFQRLATVRNELVQPDLTAAEKLRRLLEALQVEAGYGNSVEVYQDQIDIEGQVLHVDILRLGRLSLFWQTPDGKHVGHFDQAAGQWLELPGSERRRIGLAMEMASRQRPVELIDLPLGRITP